MKYLLNNSHLITGYIKELLKDYNLPVYTVMREDKPKYEGKIYLDGTNFVLIVNGQKEEVGKYSYGQHYDNFTKNFKINSSIYDLKTHYYLGNYLRFLRDYLGLDLMPLYNCFGGETPIGLNYIVTIDTKDVDPSTGASELSKYKFYIDIDDNKNYYYIVPIKFDETYTISIDCPTKVEMASIIYTGDKVLNISRELTRNTYKAYPGISVLNPVKYKLSFPADTEYVVDLDIPTIKAPLHYYEDNLRLLIKIPRSVNSSIVVMEGDYKNNLILGLKTSTFALPDLDLYTVSAPSSLSLMKINDGVSYPFSDRLVEYLLGQPVTNLSDVVNNISRIQDLVYDEKVFKGRRDIWSQMLRGDIYECLLEKLRDPLSTILKAKLVDGKWLYINPLDPKYAPYEKNLDFYKGYNLSDLKYDLLAYGDKDLEYYLEAK